MRHLWKRSKSSSSSNKSRGTDELSSKTMGESSRSMSVGSSDRSMQSSGSFRREALLKKDGANISKREFKKELKKEMKVIKIARVKSFKARQALTEMGDIDEVSEQARLAEERRRRRRSRSASSVGSRRRSDSYSVGSLDDDGNHSMTADSPITNTLPYSSPSGLIPTELTLNMTLQEEEGEDESSRRHHPQEADVEAEARGITDPSTQHEGEGSLIHNNNNDEEIAKILIEDDEQQGDKDLVADQESAAEDTAAASEEPVSDEPGTEEPVLTYNTNEASVRDGIRSTAAEQLASKPTFDVDKGTEAQLGRKAVQADTSLPRLEDASLKRWPQQSADETCSVTDPAGEESGLRRETLCEAEEASERQKRQQQEPQQSPVQLAPGAYEIDANDESSASDSEGPGADSAAGALVLGGVYLSMNNDKGGLKPTTKTNKLLSLNPHGATTTDDFSSSASTNTTSLMTHAEHDPFPLLDEPPSSTLPSFWEDDYAELEESTKRLQETIAALNLTLECSQQFEAEQIQEERAKCSAARKEEIAQQILKEADEPAVDPNLLQIRQNQEKLIDALQAENKARRKESQALNLQLLSLLNSTVRLEKATEETQVFTQEMERVHIKVHENKHQELMAEMVSCVLEEKSLHQELSKAIWGAKNERRARKAYGMGMDILLAKVQQYYDGNLLKAISELPPVVIMASFAERSNIKKKTSTRGSVFS